MSNVSASSSNFGGLYHREHEGLSVRPMAFFLWSPFSFNQFIRCMNSFISRLLGDSRTRVHHSRAVSDTGGTKNSQGCRIKRIGHTDTRTGRDSSEIYFLVSILGGPAEEAGILRRSRLYPFAKSSSTEGQQRLYASPARRPVFCRLGTFWASTGSAERRRAEVRMQEKPRWWIRNFRSTIRDLFRFLFSSLTDKKLRIED